MSDLMLHAALEMPPELWGGGTIDVVQRHGRYMQASERIISDGEKIATLTAKVESLQGEQWIECSDRLPESCDEYRIYPSVELQNYHNEAEYSPKENKWTVTEYNSWGSDDFHPNPTHWMMIPKDPLPQAPSGDK